MSNGLWYLERGGKFYGPFKTEKVYQLSDAGKINNQTKVSANKDGSEPVSFEAWRDLGGKMPGGGSAAPVKVEPLAQAQEKPVARNKGGEASGDKIWFVTQGSLQDGPYTKQELQMMVRRGDLTPDDLVVKDGSDTPLPVSSLVSVGQRPASDPKDPGLARRNASRKRLMIGVPVIVAAAAALFFFVPMGSDSSIGKAFEKYEDTSKLRKMMQDPDRRPPNFNVLVQSALRNGLNFSRAEVAKNHEKDLEVKNIEHGTWRKRFGARIQDQKRFISDGGVTYTYLFDDYGLAFAVVIVGQEFDKHAVSKYPITSFSETALPALETSNETVWSANLTEDVQAMAVWTRPSDRTDERFLDYICVVNRDAANL